MPQKKSSTKKTKHSRRDAKLGYFHGATLPALSATSSKRTTKKAKTQKQARTTRAWGAEHTFPLEAPNNGRVRNPAPSPEAEAKRLAHKKALTLKAFQTAYDNHHRRKAS